MWRHNGNGQHSSFKLPLALTDNLSQTDYRKKRT